jgi:putative transcriptional regulator
MEDEENIMADKYHYTESGLDNVWLLNGFEFVDHPGGKQVRITEIKELHGLIGEILADKKGDLTGKEIRFFRQEMLMTQGLLAKLLGVTEQTVHRWETGKADVPKPAESLIRLIYKGHFAESESGINVRKALEDLADMEDQLDRMDFSFGENIQEELEWKAA